jgi:hypothetical protein
MAVFPRTLDGLDNLDLDNLEVIDATVTGELRVTGTLIAGDITYDDGFADTMELTNLSGTTLTVLSLTDSTSSTTGSAKFAGGVGIAKALYVGTTVSATGTIAAGAFTTSGLITTNSILTGALQFSAATAIRQNTADGADTNFISMTGGGDIGPSRGGRVIVSGNERSVNAGKVQILAGDTGRIELSSNSDTIRMTVEQTGQITITGTTASTSNTTGVLVMSGGLGISNTTDASSSTNGGTFTTDGGGAFGKKLYVGTTLTVTGSTLGSTAIYSGSLSADSLTSTTSVTGATLALSGTATVAAVSCSGTVTTATLTASGTITGANVNATNSVGVKSATITSNTNDLLLNGNSATVALRPLGTNSYALLANTTSLQVTDTSGTVRTSITSGGDISCLSVTTSAAATVGTLLTTATVQVTGSIGFKNVTFTSTGNDLNINGNTGNIALRPVNSTAYNLIATPTSVQITNSSGVVKTTITNGGAIACDSITTTGNVSGLNFVGGLAGTFVPSFNTATTITYTTQSGHYYRLGNMTLITINITTTSVIDLTATTLTILNMPFNNNSGLIATGSCVLVNYELPTSTDFVTPIVPAGFNSIEFSVSRDALSRVSVLSPTTAATRSVWVQVVMYS